MQPSIFGSGFKTQGGFAGFTGVTPPVKAEDTEAAAGEDVEEECKAEFTPLVQLQQVEVNTGEENEECLLELYAPLPFDLSPYWLVSSLVATKVHACLCTPSCHIQALAASLYTDK
jgi:hypothetical protein